VEKVRTPDADPLPASSGAPASGSPPQGEHTRGSVPRRSGSPGLGLTRDDHHGRTP
jgi:hypothetical protein